MVAVPTFIRLNTSWNADPNVPAPNVLTENSTLRLQFLAVGDDPMADGPRVELRFDNCLMWRLGVTNDEGWYFGQCRYSNVAPEWGLFYELTGKDGLLMVPTDWQSMPEPGSGDRHFLFYFRDDTFECYASDWSFAGAVNICP